MPIITNHAKERFSDRVGLKKKMVDKIALKALKHGLKHGETSGRLKKFIDGLYLSHGNANNIRVYNDAVYLFRGFDNPVLITVIDLDNKLRKIALKDKKRKEEANNKQK